MNKKPESFARTIAISCAISLGVIFFIAIGALAPAVRGPIQVTSAAIEFMWLNWRAIAGVKPVEHLTPLRADLKTDRAPDSEKTQPGVTLVTGLFGERLTARLLDADGSVIHEWPVDFFELKKGGNYRFDALIHGDYLYENGDLLINIDDEALMRIGACGEIKWRTQSGPHHSIDVDDDGFIWAPLAATEYTEKRLFPMPFFLDRIGKFDPNTGEQIEVIDLVQSLVESGVAGLASSETVETWDVLHVNDIEILKRADAAAFPMFEAGDILISARQRNVVFVMDGRSHRVKWMRMGASQFQHDPDFEEDGSIVLLDNRRVEDVTAENGWMGDVGGSRIIALSPAKFEYKTLYESNDQNRFYTPRRGKHQRLANGNRLITETDAGRAFEITPEGDIVWQYVNRFSDTEAGWLVSATRYTPEFSKIGENCPAH